MSQNIGIKRSFDDLGRIVVPIELRRAMGLEPGSEMEIIATENRLIMKKCPAPPNVAEMINNLQDALVREFDNPKVLVAKLDELRQLVREHLREVR